MKTLKWVYKVIRSIIFTAIILVVAGIVAIYTALSIPPVQSYIRDRLENELSEFLGSKVMIKDLTIRPLNEVIIDHARFYDLDNKECLSVDRLGAGINLWRLITSREIEITYVELIDFRANIYQKDKESPLNIDFIIKAFEPKDKTKPPTKFDLKIHNIVLRGGEAKFSREWMPEKGRGLFDSNHLNVTGLNADIVIPRLSNDDTRIDLRRLSFNEDSGLQLKELSGLFYITPEKIRIEDFDIRLPESEIKMKELELPMAFIKDMDHYSEKLEINIYDSRITPSNLSAFYPPLSSFDSPLPINLSVSGNKDNILLNQFRIGKEDDFYIEMRGVAGDIFNMDAGEIDLENLKIDINENYLKLISGIVASETKNQNLSSIIDKIGSVNILAKGSYDSKNKEIILDSDLKTKIGEIKGVGRVKFLEEIIDSDLEIVIPEINLEGLIVGNPVDFVKDVNLKLTGGVNTRELLNSAGILDLNIGEINLLNRRIENIELHGNADNRNYKTFISVNTNGIKGDVEAALSLDTEEARWDVSANISDFDTFSSFMTLDESKKYELNGNIRIQGAGNSSENLSAIANISDFRIEKWNGKILDIRDLELDVVNKTEGINHLNLRSEIADMSLKGEYDLTKLPGMVKRTMNEILPSLFPAFDGDANCGEGVLDISVKDIQQLKEFFNLPVSPLTSLQLTGRFDSSNDAINISSVIPYIQQGNNLITDTYINADIIGKEGISKINAGTVYPTKKGLLKTDFSLLGDNGEYKISLDLNKGRNVAFFGNVSIDLLIEKDPLSGETEIVADWIPSQLILNDTDWIIEEAKIIYDRAGIRIENFCIRHDDQFIVISGYSAKDGDGEIMLNLSDINVDYVFETLNIPHVTFGGRATGKAYARAIFSPDPQIYTEDFKIKNLSYNGVVIGDGDITGKFILPELKVALGAKIYREDRRVADVDGGVWVGRDSLSFSFDADRVNAAIVKPFMKAFSSDIRGTASGKALLYGTFSDIDMTGKLVANDVELLVDYINARYTANDTVYLYPGRIELPSFVVRDKQGHTAILNGVVNHRYFHDPTFNFTITDMDRLLVYDTNAKINPLWYGTIYASGAGEITGRPGIVNIKADVTTDSGSDFTFVLSDRQEAVKSNFLTFSDRRKEELIKMREKEVKDTVPDFLKKFQKSQNTEEESNPDVFAMDIRASVTDNVKFNLIMDPAAGDKITAYGNGAMNMTYSSLTDELKIYGKYVLEKGTYNFSLQDIILKEFTIKPGSSIAFTGNPYTGTLDLTAAYKVNTSLTELDNSFANDRELNRTSVPVEALLEVSGPLMAPSIGFDIELPTVTEETAQKVKSIISTDDMMSRQVLYLVALNKFYPPEYMSTSNSGGEWASIATSTISSQIQNVIGQLTDKFSLAPSIKSDKGDFSDIEFDLGLSSQLFHNRLLINGNLGYRDPSNSSTTFIGDFDLEYLLNKKGSWRLKAYNHFNDQNYYLKSSLTTQGLGIVWRRDFGLPRKKQEDSSTGDMEKSK